MSDYQLLVAYGHSPLKALQISGSAKRHDTWAKQWLAIIRKKLEGKEVKA